MQLIARRSSWMSWFFLWTVSSKDDGSPKNDSAHAF